MLSNSKNYFFKNTIFSSLSVYGFSHLIVDAICAGGVFSLLNSNLELNNFVFLVLLYNLLAFGLQLPFGILSDILRQPKYFAIIGLLTVTLGGLTIFYFPLAGVFFLGIGNALFHIGGGSIALNLTPKKSTAPGIFVAPGAIGLLIGTIFGKAGLFNPYIFGIIVFVLVFFIDKIKETKINYDKNTKTNLNYFWAILMLLFLVIVFRSIIGFAVNFPWKTDLTLLIALTTGVFLGKVFGGILGDKFGWMNIGVGGLIISAPLIFLGTQNPFLGIIGLFLFNFTMPITLTAMSNLFLGQPGFSFGLTCTALLLGLFPSLSGTNNPFTSEINLFFAILLSALILFVALVLMENKKPSILNSKKS